MTEPTPGNLPTAPPEEKKGNFKKKTSKPSTNGKFEKFRNKKNQEFQQQLTASILKRLKVSDPTTVAAIPLRSSIVPSHIPIVFRGLPRFVSQLWLRMKSIGTRPFQALSTDANYAVFLKVILHIAEAKIAYAQMNCTQPPRQELSSNYTFTEMQLRTISSLAKVLPYPIVIYLESIGNFTIDRQNVLFWLFC